VSSDASLRPSNSHPFAPSTTTSPTPNTAAAAVGTPNAMASRIERGSDSMSDALIMKSAARYQR
jgi:hypothetical protein